MFHDVRLCRYRETIKQNESQENRFDAFLAVAPEIDRMSPRRFDLMTFQHWLKKSTKPIQDARFDDFVALAPDIEKTNPRKLDLMTFRPWLQKSTNQHQEA